MRISDFFKPPTKIKEEAPPTYKESDAEVFIWRFIKTIDSVRNVAMVKSDYACGMYINARHFSGKLLIDIHNHDNTKALKHLKEVKKYADELFAHINTPLLHKHIYYGREIFRNIEVILNND